MDWDDGGDENENDGEYNEYAEVGESEVHIPSPEKLAFLS